ncbi:antirestriction protein ArdA [Microbulbifer sp. JMSA002]|uniref:antirestriction protein ArdA n=1 Tax=Microbulbifer sp. JMSA002 TaxID=3243368 RepID=UPI00403A5E81
MANITFYELSTYNNGLLLDFEIDLDDLSSEEELLEAVQEKLKELKEKALAGEYPNIAALEVKAGYYTFEEYRVADSEDVPDKYVGEYSLDSEYWEYKEIAEEHGAEVVNAALSIGYALESIGDHYRGHVEPQNDDDGTLGEWAYQNDHLGEIPSHLASYIDWDSVGRDLNCSGWHVMNGHIFSV